MTLRYEIQIARKAAALYLAWEYGTARAIKMLAAAKRDPQFSTHLRLDSRVFLTNKAGRYTRRAADGYASRIKEVVSYQLGRLGQPLGDAGGVYVREIYPA